MALPALAPYLLPAAIGAIGGGFQAAGQGKNPLEIASAAAIGGGLGAGGGALGRMAGSALAGSPLLSKIAPNFYRAGGALPSWLTGMTSMAVNPATQAKLGQRALAGLIGTTTGSLAASATPGLAAGLAGAPGAAIRAAGGGARNAAGAGLAAANAAGVPGVGPNPTAGMYPYLAEPIPAGADPTFGYGSPYGTLFDITNPLGRFAGSLTAEKMAADVQVRNMQNLLAAQAPYIEGRSKAELARNLYAATVRNNLATQQQLLLGGVGNARAMGRDAANIAGQAIAQQYQYS
jgi:hypothetical protein